jgi:double-stranded uracil-DNA glycosylase
MSLVYSFAPVENPDARVLILGSMPGEASLRAGEYYAHPRNHFWRLMGELVSLDLHSPYPQRVQALSAAGIVLWDVLYSCRREGSLDANIDKSSYLPNDFPSFFMRHPNISHVFFNGSAAENIYRKKVLPVITTPPVEYFRLPSSSPANASFSFERKLEAWKIIVTI